VDPRSTVSATDKVPPTRHEQAWEKELPRIKKLAALQGPHNTLSPPWEEIPFPREVAPRTEMEFPKLTSPRKLESEPRRSEPATEQALLILETLRSDKELARTQEAPETETRDPKIAALLPADRFPPRIEEYVTDKFSMVAAETLLGGPIRQA
jgi:hypothetical protein